MPRNVKLPRTSRINEKIVEYYMKFGQERDLEKFMRLHSPCSNQGGSRSHSSTNTHSSCTSEEEGRVLRRLFLCGSDMSADTEEETPKTREHLIPIMLLDKETDKGGSPTKERVAASAPELKTPRSKTQQEKKQAKTPDSISKSHRRLEWDSLGDVGYRKSMSTSNISILERSLLKEFFQEKTSSSSAIESEITKSDKDLKLIEIESEREECRTVTKSTQSDCSKYNTPPLASSTLFDVITAKNIQSNKYAGVRPKYISQGTSTSLQKRFEKCAQTSIQRPVSVASREVQVTMSSVASSTSSVIGGSATPSSFDSYSSRSVVNSTDASTDKQTTTTKLPKKLQSHEPNHSHPFVVGITEMLARRKALSAKTNNKTNEESISKKPDEVQQLHNTLKIELNENKENSAVSVSQISSPQLDLGIELLCSLIDARSLNEKQKKKLVHNIVKRISRLKAGADDDHPGHKTVVTHKSASSRLTSATSSNKSTSSGSKSISTVTVARAAKGTNNMDENNSKDVPSKEQHPQQTSSSSNSLISIQVHDRSVPTTSSDVLAKSVSEIAQSSKTNTETKLQIMFAQKTIEEEDMQNKDQSNVVETDELLISLQSTNRAAKRSTNSPSSSTSTSSKDVTTEKPANKIVIHSSDTDTGPRTDLGSKDLAGQSSMRDWLNPMTQSEIEYEEKKREFARNAVKREQIFKRIKQTETARTERESQLEWIDAEIRRLESLRNLLLKPSTDESSEQVEEKLYDTVFSERKAPSDSSPLSSENANRHLMQEIDVIVEESNEDMVELDENLKRTKQRIRETQIVYDKPTELLDADGNLKQGNTRFRNVTETITTNEQQIFPIDEQQQQPGEPEIPKPPTHKLPTAPVHTQRSKISTPTPSDSNDSNSVASFAQQRKREFLKQYRNKKLEHYESLLHQQQQLLIQQQQKLIQELQERCSVAPKRFETVPNDQYSVPHVTHAGHRVCCQCNTEQRQYNRPYFQRNKPMNDSLPAKSTAPRPTTSMKPAIKITSSKITNKHQITQETSSSSMFCISSEISIPMGSSTTTSSTTTTHQYDDVPGIGIINCGVGVQTTDSLKRSKPIFGSRYCCSYGRNDFQSRPMGRSTSVQVKPKAIAYVIQFDSTTTTTTTTTTTNISALKSNDLVGDDNNESSSAIAISGEEQPQFGALRDYLEQAKPEFLAHTKERKAILNQIQMLRQQRGQELRDIIETGSISSLETRLERLPPPPTKQIRIFPTKEMKALTSKHYNKLPEVVKKQERIREERHRNGNRIIRDIFNRRLQRRVRSGRMSLNHSTTVI